jgi:hypothetical protein
MLVSEIVKGQLDDAGEEVINVYAKNSPNYAVYQTEDRVRIHYADDPTKAKEQRTSIAQLNPIRSEINGLIDGWRGSKSPNSLKRAFNYSLRASDGLIVALEEDAVGSLAILNRVKQDIVDERTSKARFQYLTVASAVVLIAVILFWSAILIFSNMIQPKSNIWTGAAAGAIGAFFSVAIGIRSRTILTDLHFRDNSSDALLRVVIGLIAGAFLVCVVESKLVSFIVDSSKFDDNPLQWLYVLIIGFAGGFSERMVPDLLAKSFSTASASPSALTPALVKAALEVKAQSVATKVVLGSEAAAVQAPIVVDATTDSESDEDSCLCHAGVQDDEATGDTELPPSYGGVAAARA